MKKTNLILGISLLGTLLSCDVPHDAVICNGFHEAARVIYYGRSVAQPRQLKMRPGECVAPSVAISLTDEELQGIHDLPDGIVVVSDEGKVLAQYELGVVYMRPGLHSSPQWVLTKEGVFLVPMEFENIWAVNIDKIQKLSKPASLNLQRR